MSYLRRLDAVLAATLLAASVASAGGPPPEVSAAMNAASFADPETAGGKLARGGVFSVFGERLRFSGSAVVGSFPLPTELGGVSVEATVSGVTRSAFLLFLSYEQINAVLPSDLPAGEGTLVVRTPFGESEPLEIEVVDHAFGVFTLRSSGDGPGVLTDPLDMNPNTAVNTALRSAHDGEMWDLWGTGLGPIPTSDGEAPPMGDRADLDVRVLVDGREAEVLYRGRSPCCAGLDQIRFVVPEGVEGCCIEVQVIVEGVESNVVTMSAGPAGDFVCDRDAFSPETLELYLAGKARQGSIHASRSIEWSDPEVGLLWESFSASFVELPISLRLLDPCAEPLEAPYPNATCQVSQGARRTVFFDAEGVELGRVTSQFPGGGIWFNVGDFSAFETNIIPQSRFDPVLAGAVSAERLEAIGDAQVEQIVGGIIEPRFLDAGTPVVVEAPAGDLEMETRIPGDYTLILAEQEPFEAGSEFHLVAGSYTVRVPGGADVTAFAADAELPEPFDWTSRAAAFPTIDREQDLPIAWSGGSPDFGDLLIFGSSPRDSSPGMSSLACRVPYEARSYTIPATVLQAVYASEDTGRLSIAGGVFGQVEPADLDFVRQTWTEHASIATTFTGEGEEPAPLEVVRRVEPEYPAAAREAGVSGVVAAVASFDRDGDRVRDVHILSGPEPLREAVRLALLQWEFSGDVGPSVVVRATFTLPDQVETTIVE